jgi:anti-repressor protein
MGKLVFIENSRLVTDSVTVAETFGKRHADVLRSIENLECSQEFNFASVEYRDAKGESRPKYLITQDGFSFLVMGYTGKEAARFKEMYIGEFNRMREELNKPQFALPQTKIEALEAYLDEMKKTALLEAKIEADRPLMLFAESLQISEDSILIGELAKLLKQNGINIGQNRLFITLRKEGYLMSHGEQYNMPTQRSMDLKLMEIKTGSRNGSDGTIRITRTPKITGKGQSYFINKFKSQNQAM